MDESENPAFKDLAAVNLDNRSEVAHWLDHWNINEEQLREAVANSNNNLVSTIAAYLKKQSLLYSITAIQRAPVRRRRVSVRRGGCNDALSTRSCMQQPNGGAKAESDQQQGSPELGKSL